MKIKIININTFIKTYSFIFIACRHDKFAAARDILDRFNLQLAEMLQCGAYLVQDETLYPFRLLLFLLKI